jgi:hypothetical protein
VAGAVLEGHAGGVGAWICSMLAWRVVRPHLVLQGQCIMLWSLVARLYLHLYLYLL